MVAILGLWYCKMGIVPLYFLQNGFSCLVLLESKLVEGGY